MSFPSVQVTTTNLDSGTDDPSLARADLLDAVQKLNEIIAGADAADGCATLNSSGTIESTQVPSTLSPSTTLTLNPSTGFVKIQNILRLQSRTTDQLENTANITAGDVAYCQDGDTGSPCIAVYNGTDWLRISLGTAISAT
jgi:hypothetical protein